MQAVIMHPYASYTSYTGPEFVYRKPWSVKLSRFAGTVSDRGFQLPVAIVVIVKVPTMFPHGRRCPPGPIPLHIDL